MYGESLTEFNGQRVVDYNGPKNWKGAAVAYRLRVEYDDKKTFGERLDALVEQPGSDQITALVVGTWQGVWEGQEAGEVVRQIVAAAPRFQQLRALFFGDITYEECEISWINQSDVTPLVLAFDQLEVFRVRGGNGLSFSRMRHDRLRELAIETGGLPRSALRELFLCDLPALERIELLLGESNYGFDGGVEDLQPLLSGRLYPRLKYLGLMNSEIANEIAAVVVNSPIVGRIDTLDLSLGNLDNEGVQSLLALASQPGLKRVDISHHYATDDAIARLTAALSCEVIADDKQEPDDEWRPIVHAE